MYDIRNFELFDPETGRLNTKQYRTNTVLRKDEWKDLDARVVMISRQRLNGVADLQAAGLTQPLGGLGVTISEYEKSSGLEPASLSMDLDAQQEEDRQKFSLVSLPVPVLQKDFRIGLRNLESSRRMGRSLDVSTSDEASKNVSELAEDILFKGAGNINVNGQTVVGYTTEPNRNTGSGSNWGSPDNIDDDVLEMVAGVEADGYEGPFILYVASTQAGETRAYPTGDNNRPVWQRIIDQIPAITAIKSANRLPDGVAVLVQMTSDVVDIAVAADLQTIEWQPSPFTTRFKVFMAMTPRPKSDDDGKSGIFHMTGI